MKPLYYIVMGCSAFLLLAACSRAPETGPVDIRWDRDVCARCIMAVSDHFYSAEVRGAPSGESTIVYKFDDLGCAVIWLGEQPWKDDPRTEMWVTHYETGEWLDAYKASYITGRTTPMDYGLGAQAHTTPGALAYEQAAAAILKTNERADWEALNESVESGAAP